MLLWRGTIIGECCSKANSRRIVMFGNRPASIKSDKARAYADDAALQIPKMPLHEGPVSVECTIWYRTRRPDLDPSLILDALQGRIIVNDRQVVELIARKGWDRKNPRAEVIVKAMETCA